MEAQRPRWSPRTKIIVSLTLVALGIYLLYRFGVVLKPLILAVVLAYILSPLVSAFQQRLKIRRTLAALLAYLLLIVAMVAIPMVIIPPLAAQSKALNLDLLRFLSQIETLLGNEYHLAGQVIHIEGFLQEAIRSLQGLIEPIFGQTLEVAIEVISSLVWVIFIFVVSFYLLKDGHALRAWVEELTPPEYRYDLNRMLDEINRIWAAFFRGQLVLALVVATIFTIIGFILGLPFALAMGVFAGLLEFLPSIGHGIWLAFASLLALFAGSTWLHLPNWVFMLIVVGLHLVFQQFDLNYLIPRIIGRSVHLHPLVVILGIVSGAVLAGVLGILLAAPTIASARVIGRYIFANLLDRDPFAGTVAPPLPPPNPHWWRKPVPDKAGDLPREL